MQIRRADGQIGVVKTEFSWQSDNKTTGADAEEKDCVWWESREIGLNSASWQVGVCMSKKARGWKLEVWETAEEELGGVRESCGSVHVHDETVMNEEPSHRFPGPQDLSRLSPLSCNSHAFTLALDMNARPRHTPIGD